ncbi:amino acid adenylation domain-containing protein [Lentzea sp. NPDC059081]|uniref:amino acid adenylation domain-containing protein n=1 Tax=Lentzea sp. NPDC059081 TaxID=3346719 RepID=UPI00367AEFE6
MTADPDQRRAASAGAARVVAARVRATTTAAREAIASWQADGGAVEPVPALSRLFGGRPGPRTGTEIVPVRLDDHTSAALTELAAGAPVRLLAVLASAAGLVVARCANRDDLLVHTPSVGGTGAPLAPLSVPGADGELVTSLVDRMTATASKALGVARALPAETAERVFGGHEPVVAVCVRPWQEMPDDVELVCVAEPGGTGIGLTLRFDTARVGDELIRRVAGWLATVLGQLVVPGTVVRDVELMSADERETVLFGLCNAGLPELRAQPLHHRVREIALSRPDDLALVHGDRALTYAELHRAALVFADRIAGAGVVAGDRVGLLLHRGDLPVVAVLGCFALGAVYVPIDTRHPVERIRSMLGDCGARLLVTETSLRHKTGVGHTGRVLVVDSVDELTGEAPERLGPGRDAPAYAIYTSGTSGTPKAVLISHGAFASTMEAYAGCYRLTGVPVCLQLGSFAFDVFNGDLGRSLYAGGTLVVCPDEVRAEIDGIADLITRHRVTVLESTPVLVNPLAEALSRRPEALEHLEVVVSSADAWVVRDYDVVRKLIGDHVRVLNVYGCTEASIDQTCFAPEAFDERDRPNYVPIGRPMAHSTAYVVDERLRLLPPGAPGELCVGGHGVGEGYLGRDDLTARKFVADPFTRTGRMYRTGDLVRFLPSGDLEFLGRIDQQVKIRGFRVELGEVESVLRAHPAVRDVVAVALDDGAGSHRLVAYLVTDGDLPDVAGLHAFCGGFLPGYMVPSAFVGLAELPLSRNGKVDRAALPAPGAARPETGAPLVAPRTGLERTVAGVWADLLGLDEVGVFDDFFLLGGHSLIATRVVAALEELCGVRVPVRTLFDSPTVAALAEAMSALSPSLGVPAPRADPMPEGGLVPASATQTRLWFGEQWRPGTAVNTMPLVLRLRGALDVAAVRFAVDALVVRHESLRTVFRSADGVPLQLILDPFEVAVDVVDETGRAGVPAGELAAVRAVLDEPFDLEQGPLLRARLVRTGDNEHVLAMAVHHLVADGWSIGILLAELEEHYTAACSGRADPPAPLEWQYRHHARWQGEALTEEVVAEQAGFWRRHLDGVRDLVLPTDRPRPAEATGTGAAVRLDLPEGLVARASAFAREQGTTLFTVLLAAYEVLLHRYSQQDLFAVGTVTAGRSRAEFADVVGFFVNTVPVRADLSGSPTFRRHVAGVRSTVLDAFAHQDVPFDRVVAELSPPRNPGVPPIFQACLSLENEENTRTRFGDLAVSEEPVGLAGSRFDLLLELAARGGGLSGALTYATDLFDRATAERMARGFETVLAAALEHPDSRVADLDVVGPADLAVLVAAETGAHRDHRPELLHEAIWRQAPDAVALVENGVTTSFRELIEAADGLAARLVAEGVGPEDVVAVHLPRSADLVIAMLAVLRAGGAYLPVEPELPAGRVAFMLRDSAARVVLTGTPAAGYDIPAVDVRDRLPAVAVPAADSAGAAYVLYTSGSTGRPKAVVVTHAAIDNRLRWMQAEYGLDATDRVLLKTPAGFDVSVWEVFWPLREGVPLVISEPGGHRDPVYLAGLIAAERVTTVHFVPSMLDVFVNSPGSSACVPMLRRVICSGEALPPDLVATFGARFGVELHNLYGPTEAAVDVTHWRCRVDPAGRVPIGSPVWNTSVRVLDRNLRRVPVGVPGELHLVGVQLARGYLGRGGLTADRFVPDPFGAPGSRMYRTGDVVRWGAGGGLDYLGRTDHQTKIRGQRVELGEVEHALRAHPAISGATVVAGTDQRGDQRLVAYVVAGELDVVEVKRALGTTLPAYMVPAVFVTMDELPLSRNGKVDRAALPDPDAGPVRTEEGFAGPRSELERRVAGVWRDVLGVAEVGVFDDFFSLGGHSLVATRVVARLEDLLGVRVGVRTLFEAPTVAALAEELAALEPVAVPPRPAPRRFDRSQFLVEE